MVLPYLEDLIHAAFQTELGNGRIKLWLLDSLATGKSKNDFIPLMDDREFSDNSHT